MVGQAAEASSKGGVRTGFQSGSTALQNLHATSSLHSTVSRFLPYACPCLWSALIVCWQEKPTAINAIFL